MADNVEEMATQQLETAIREMFQFSGWDDGVDDDAADAVHKVEVALDRLDAVREVRRIAVGTSITVPGSAPGGQS